jgi:argininosuccinate lyase
MKLWGARFSGRRDPLFEEFSESFSFDRRLIAYDLRVNRAYVRALGRANVLKASEVQALVRGLDAIARETKGNPNWHRGQSSEDVHTWVERRLERKAGPVALKLRTGRSRNDLVATDTRLYTKNAVAEIEAAACEVLGALLEKAESNSQAILPGFTHLQPAQPLLFAHYLLAYFQMLLRDVSRLRVCRTRADEMPMGSGALAGAAYRIDRRRLARELGFERVSANSLDATCDRDFVCELMFACSLILLHLSRLAEDLIIYSSPAFGFVEMADAYSTGSSLMPQKKNPDALELIRGKSARVAGRLSGMLALLKALPLGYDRDLQEDKPALFDGVETTRDSLLVAARVIRTLRVLPGRMSAETERGFLTATDVADELARRGVPFAEAHEQVGRLVKHCLAQGKSFREVTASEARRFVPSWDQNLSRVAESAMRAVERRTVVGGTAPARVKQQLRQARKALVDLRKG